MSKRKGKQMSNLPHSYIEAMEGLQMENEQLRQRILTLENQAKNNEVLDLVSGLLPTIEDSGVIGLTIAEKVIPKLSENETPFFIAGFMEAIKYIKTNNR